nr:MAG TPA: hypothetical protein [Caudoviricetes sp.]
MVFSMYLLMFAYSKYNLVANIDIISMECYIWKINYWVIT